MPEDFSAAPLENGQAVLKHAWWEGFGRPMLNEIVVRAQVENQNVLQAAARLEQAKSLFVTERSALFPQIDVEGDVEYRREDGNTRDAVSSIGGALEWEVDVFGRIRSASEARLYEALAQEELLEATKLTLSAEIAEAYFGAAAAQQTLLLLNQQVRLDEELLQLLELRLESGVGNNVDVLQQKSRVAESESLVPVAQADLRVFENRLDVLVGQVPDGQNRVSSDETLSFKPLEPVAGVPAGLLLQRPDLRSLQAELIAADASIAAAIADRLPEITLDGAFFYQDSTVIAGPVGLLMGAFVQPLLDWGERKAEVERNKALYTERLAAFTQGFLEAVEEVENALYQENRQREFIRRLEIRRDILQETVDETEARYSQGIDDYLPVLNALQELRFVERALISERLALILFRIRLHRALGGRF